MRKIILGLFLLFSCIAADAGKAGRGAETCRFDARIGWGGYPAMSVRDYSGYRPYLSLDDLYADYSGKVYSTGVISADFSYSFRKWFALSLSIGYNGLFSDMMSSVTGQKVARDRGYAVSVMANARFVYVSRPRFRLYSSIGLGIGTEKFRMKDLFLPASHVTILGVTFGSRVYGFCEYGVGMDYVGGMVGIGYRF